MGRVNAFAPRIPAKLCDCCRFLFRRKALRETIFGFERLGVFSGLGACAAAMGPDLRKFRAEEQNLGGVINPRDEDHNRSRGTVCTADCSFSDVHADSELT